MAIYHLEAKIISRGTGRSAVAAAAYMGCDVITNEYDGITHDYTRIIILRRADISVDLSACYYHIHHDNCRYTR